MTSAAQTRAFNYYLSLAGEAPADFEAINKNWPQIERAWKTIIQTQSYALGVDSILVQFAFAYSNYMLHTGKLEMAMRWIGVALTTIDSDQASETSCKLLRNAASLNYRMGFYQASIRLLYKAYEQAVELNLDLIRNSVLADLAATFGISGNLERAIKIYEDLFNIHKKNPKSDLFLRTLNNMWSLSRGTPFEQKVDGYFHEAHKLNPKSDNLRHSFLHNTGVAHKKAQRYDAALSHFNSALSIAQQAHSQQQIAVTLNSLGSLYENMGQYEEASDKHLEALMLFRLMGDQENIGQSLLNIGHIFYATGQWEQAHKYVDEASAIWRKLKSKKNLANCLNSLGAVLIRLDNYAGAQQSFLEAKQLAAQTQDTELLMIIKQNLSLVSQPDIEL